MTPHSTNNNKSTKTERDKGKAEFFIFNGYQTVNVTITGKTKSNMKAFFGLRANQNKKGKAKRMHYFAKVNHDNSKASLTLHTSLFPNFKKSSI